MSWSNIELPKVIGGVGVGHILYKNIVLLFKWWWRFSGSDSSFWKQILISIHNIKGMKASSESFGNIKCGTWAQLLSDDNDTRRIREIIEDGLVVNVGDGTSTRFWHDKWCASGPLRHSFPRLFSISEQGDALISQMGEWRNGAWSWIFVWRRRLYDWECAELDSLKLLIEPCGPRIDKVDGISWHGKDYVKFPIQVIMDKLNESDVPTLPKPIASLIWTTKVPPRAHLVFWLSNLEKLKTGDFLVAKGIIDPAHALCPFCKCVLETNSHNLFTCSFSWNVWMLILDWWGISGVLPNRCGPFFLAWRHLAPKRVRGKLWDLILGCVIWSLWFLRNKVKFGVDMKQFFSTLKIRVEIWAKELLGAEAMSSTVAC